MVRGMVLWLYRMHDYSFQLVARKKIEPEILEGDEIASFASMLSRYAKEDNFFEGWILSSPDENRRNAQALFHVLGKVDERVILTRVPSNVPEVDKISTALRIPVSASYDFVAPFNPELN